MLLLKDVVCHQPALTVQYETQLFMLLLTLRQDPAIQVRFRCDHKPHSARSNGGQADLHHTHTYTHRFQLLRVPF